MTRISAAVAAIIAVPLGLAGCSPAPSDTVQVVAAAVAESDSAISDVYVAAHDGVGGTSLRLRVYTDAEGDADVARILDASLRALITSSPVRPGSFTIDVAAGAKPSDINLNVGAIDLEGAARAGDFYSLYSDDALTGPGDELESRYGTWDELHP